MLFALFCLLWPLLYALGVFGVGAVAVANETIFAYAITFTAGILLPLRGIFYLWFVKKNKGRFSWFVWVQTVLECCMAVGILCLPKNSYRVFLSIFGVILTFHIVVQGINAFIYFKNKVFSQFIPALCQCALFLNLIGGIIVLPEELRYRFLISGAGFFLSVLGQAYLCDWLSIVIKNQRVAGFFRKLSVTMPGFGGLLVPFRLLKQYKETSDNQPPDAEIIFNFGKNGTGLAGHCELCVDGYTYTYGNYNPTSRSVFNTVGNGIVFRAPKEEYIDFLVEHNRRVVVYGLRFTKEQRKRFRETLCCFDKNLTSWQTQAQAIVEEEYIHKVLRLNPSIFRVEKGRFRTYFLPTINCVTLTGSLLKGTAAGNIVVPGVYTPGSYWEALHRVYLSGSDEVFSVKTHGM